MNEENESNDEYSYEQLSLLSPLELRDKIIQQSMQCNEKQCRFVDNLFENNEITQVQAYKDAGYTSTTERAASANAAKLKKIPKVANYIKLRRELHRKTSCLNSNLLIGHQMEMMQKSAEEKDYTGSSKIGGEVSKLCGFYPDKGVTKTEVVIQSTRGELEAKLLAAGINLQAITN